MESTAITKPTKASKFAINICNARHELPLLQAIIDRDGYQTVHIKDAKANMHWQFPLHEKENNDRIFETKAIFNRLPGLGFASNKRRLALIYRRMQE